jgi:hypothetical protein
VKSSPISTAATSPPEGSALQLQETEQLTAIIRRFADGFTDHLKAERIEHSLKERLVQRVYALARGMKTSTTCVTPPPLAAVVGKLDLTGRNRQSPGDRRKALAGR